MASFPKLALAALGLLGSVASTAISPPRNAAPTVSVKNGSYAGVYNEVYNQDLFLGIPYAQKPERFAIAKELNTTWEGLRQATELPLHCVGYGIDSDHFKQSEDCLHINVIRPAGVKNTSDLPVAVWVHGGGLLGGGSADPRYNLSYMVDHSVQIGKPIIGVSFNYRLSVFGFVNSKEAIDAGIANNGFRDQRLALRWVQENIQAFGGSPKKVTIFGESSGAESVTFQLLAYNGRDDGLFRGVIGQSGFGGAIVRHPGGMNATDMMQGLYDNLVANVSSCANLVGSPESLDCLRKAPIEEINSALNVTGVQSPSWSPVVDDDFIQDLPTNQITEGRFPKMPLLIGATTDEGTVFSASYGSGAGISNTDDDVRRKVGNIIPKDVEKHTGKHFDQVVQELIDFYPNDQSVGIPSLKTWPHIITPNDTFAKTLGLQYRRVAALFGDYYMQYQRRLANVAWSKHGIPSYAYRWDVTPNGTPETTGATHFVEIAFVFHNTNGTGYAINPFGGNGTYPAKAKALAGVISSAWINFVTDLDPNGKNESMYTAEKIGWPQYHAKDGVAGKALVFDLCGGYFESDDWRAKPLKWFADHSISIFGN